MPGSTQTQRQAIESSLISKFNPPWELMANGPNEVWSWDITKLRGPVKHTYFYLYVILDIYSRYVVGWTVQNPAHGSGGAIVNVVIQ